MKLADAVKPISYLKANAAEIIRKIDEEGQPLVITQNGEAKAVLMSVREYDQMRQSLAMMVRLARSAKNLEEGRYKPASEAFTAIRARQGR